MLSDERYAELKKELCRKFNFCNDECPLYYYMSSHGVHACGALCEVLEVKDIDQAKKLVAEAFDVSE